MEGCSGTQPRLVLLSSDGAARGVWEVDIAALGKANPGAGFSPHSLWKRRLRLRWLSACLVPGTSEPAGHFQPQTEWCLQS